MKVVEIFQSIEGEGLRSGLPATFIRLYGCNCRCSFCDTPYSYTGNEYTEMTTWEIVKAVEDAGIPNVTITGGEPLIHQGIDELINRLLLNDFNINVETNGSIPLTVRSIGFKHGTTPAFMYTMDWKSVSSKMHKMMLEKNLSILCPSDVLKFVVSNQEDLDQMRDVLSMHHIKAQVFVSPVFGEIEPQEIVQYVLDNNLHNVRVQLQLHKIIWPVDMRGV